ncbi:alpha/beta hydrolase [Candidatus Saccharibacteria bacterium]|nr:alpha/beta hydrolase [Candidatus Saccharibacteria bacterium]
MFDFILHRVFNYPFTMRIRYDRPVKNAGITIVFLHGIASSYAAWRKTVNEIAKNPDFASARLIGLDLIGFGKNKKTNCFCHDYENYEKSLSHTIKKLRIKTPLVLAGHSMGCLISADYTAKHPENIQALVMVSPPFLKPQDIRTMPDKFYRKSFTKMKDRPENLFITTISGFLSKISTLDSKSIPTLAFKECMENIILNEENWHTVSKLNIPTYIIHGRLDPLVSGSNLKNLAAKNEHIQLTKTAIGVHDITGIKRRRVISALQHAILKT